MSALCDVCAPREPPPGQLEARIERSLSAEITQAADHIDDCPRPAKDCESAAQFDHHAAHGGFGAALHAGNCSVCHIIQRSRACRN
jgi:hypothetical protein